MKLSLAVLLVCAVISVAVAAPNQNKKHGKKSNNKKHGAAANKREFEVGSTEDGQSGDPKEPSAESCFCPCYVDEKQDSGEPNEDVEQAKRHQQHTHVKRQAEPVSAESSPAPCVCPCGPSENKPDQPEVTLDEGSADQGNDDQGNDDQGNVEQGNVDQESEAEKKRHGSKKHTNKKHTNKKHANNNHNAKKHA